MSRRARLGPDDLVGLYCLAILALAVVGGLLS